MRIINDRLFLAEYERRLDKVVEYDLKKRYRFGRKLGEGVTAAVFRVQEKATGQFFALKKIPLKHSASLQVRLRPVVRDSALASALGFLPVPVPVPVPVRWPMPVLWLLLLPWPWPVPHSQASRGRVAAAAAAAAARGRA